MTVYKVFEKMLKDVTDPAFQHRDNHLTIRMEHEIDDETMCEGYVIDYTNTGVYSRFIFMEKPSGDVPITNIEVFMDVKYESCQPVGLIFYDDKEKQHRLFSGPIYDSLKNPFCQIFFDAESNAEDPSSDVWIKRTIILDGLANLIDMTVYGLVMNM
jgi:hypothetical protein